MIKKNTINNNNKRKHPYDRRHKWMQQKNCEPLFLQNDWLGDQTKVEKYDENSIDVKAALVLHARSTHSGMLLMPQ